YIIAPFQNRQFILQFFNANFKFFDIKSKKYDIFFTLNIIFSFHNSKILHSGVVNREAAVENTTSFTANSASPSYFAASIVVVAPAGMAASSTLTPMTRRSICTSRQGIHTRSGMNRRRSTV